MREGAQRFSAALDASALKAVESAIADLSSDQAGFRLHGIVPLRPLLIAPGLVGEVAASVLGEACRPVRAILFDKNPTTNWSLRWHQDRVIAVKQRIEVEGFGPWTIKSGLPHVAPPFEILAGMITLRVHLDPVPVTNAPLIIAPGSHRLGRISESEVSRAVRQCGTMACLADAGDIWLYATPILHASEAALKPEHRRVLQVDYAVADLPGGLEWLGV
ncbi:phytanoyl-CoA dioxygenase family protein [Hypericibacter terrae]|uniref:phytanoyl-CoA dioxygenase family protein n=1 Tax=Hypericibacter terrae TaxID=2602015 RepID=UPI001247C1CE|nr:phytanoyl-CoA dioxygenase family protein [Hypericibacter terrae]